MTSLTQFKNQIGGHKGLIVDEIGKIMKPLQPPPRGIREVKFYEFIYGEGDQKNEDKKNESTPGPAPVTENEILYDNASTIRIRDAFKQILPKFYGVTKYQDQDYIILENITFGFERPCVMDIKIGKNIWDRFTPPEKIAKRMTKYITREPLGLCLIGCIYYDKNGEQVRVEKGHGKIIDVPEFIDLLKSFLTSQSNCEVSGEILTQLLGIRNIFETQTIYEFNSSSILISYDGQHKSQPSCPRVRLIDFAHCLQQETRNLDENFLYGLNHLVEIIHSIQTQLNKSVWNRFDDLICLMEHEPQELIACEELLSTGYLTILH